MAITYTTAAERDVRRAHHRRWSVAALDPALTGASVLAALLMFAAYQGAFATSRTGDIAAPIVNLNTVADLQTLETVFEPVLPMPGDRRLAARELLSFLVQADGARRTVPNVGAIARVRVPEATIDRAPTAAAYRDRLRDERARTAAAGTEGPRSVSLLTSAQLAAIKPSLIVRDRASVRAPAPHMGRALSHRLPRGVCGVAVARASRRSRPARGRPRADGGGLRRDGQPAGSAARSAPVRALCRGRGGGLDGRRRRCRFSTCEPAACETSAICRFSARSCCRFCSSSPESDRGRPGATRR